MKPLILLLLMLWSCTVSLWADDYSQPIATWMKRLEQTVLKRPEYREKREAALKQLRQKQETSMSDEDRFRIWESLLEEYRTYDSDDAQHAIDVLQGIARQSGQPSLILQATMCKADFLCTVGMFKESLDLMDGISLQTLPQEMRYYYFHIYRTIYGLMADFAATDSERHCYQELTDQYRDSLLHTYSYDDETHALILADQYNSHQQPDEAIRLLKPRLAQLDTRHKVAIFAYTLSEAYRLMGNVEEQKRYLMVSAIADIETAVREYVSLRKLAVLLYQEGDIDRAYTFLTICMEDAELCNARMRKLEILEIFPIVNDAYQQKVLQQKSQLKWALIFISLLSLFLLMAIFYVYKQMKRVAAARKEVLKANRSLKELNKELESSNDHLKEANRSIAENSYLKEEYIGHYMDQCSAYLEKMDKYRRSLGKIAAGGNIEELYKHIKSSKFIDDELKDFYANFDTTFLQLFPTFVEEFNALLLPDEQIHPKMDGHLNTELRIFALIRLGITDSVKIAQFLRYSVTTIYNYRTKVRNKAAGDRDLLEQKVASIGR